MVPLNAAVKHAERRPDARADAALGNADQAAAITKEELLALLE